MLDILFKWEFSARDKSLFKRKPTTDFKSIRNDFDDAVAESKIEKRAPRGPGYTDIFAAMVSLCSTALKSCENTLANFHSYLTDTCDKRISDSALNRKLNKPEVKTFLKGVLNRLRSRLTGMPKFPYVTCVQRLCRNIGVSDVLTIDGTYLPVLASSEYQNDAGSGRTGIGIHALCSLIHGAICGITITQQSSNERLYVQVEDLKNILILADRGYPSYELLAHLLERDKENNVKFVFRFNPHFKMEIKSAVNGAGEPLQLNEVTGEVNVRNNKHNRYICIRVLMHKPRDCKGVPKTIEVTVHRTYSQYHGTWNYFVTNVDPEVLPAYQVSSVYRIRWACELIYKCAKSYTSMSAGVNSRHFNIVLFFIIASIAAMFIRTLIASLMRGTYGPISMMKVHSRIKGLPFLINAMALIAPGCKKPDKDLQDVADRYEKRCKKSHTSKRDQKLNKDYMLINEILSSNVYDPYKYRY